MTTQTEENTDSSAAAPGARPSSGLTWALLAVVAAAGALVYLNSLAGVFILDDLRGIVENEGIRDFANLRPRQPLTNLTFAINHRLGALAVGGYHVVNIVIHVLAACALFGLVRRTLLLASSDRFGAAAPWLAFAVALLWAVHPLQTQSVTYLSQRSESLMGLFYLLTLYCIARGAGGHGSPVPWYTAAIVACGLGMGSKAVMVTAPVVALLYDRIFIASTFREIARRRGWLYGGLAAMWGVLLYSGIVQGVFFPGESVTAVGFGYDGVTPIEYVRTQPEVILYYLRLVAWPQPLCLDYWWRPATATSAIGPSIMLLVLLAATAFALWKQPRLGFLAAVFFLILAPTSSFIPIRDLAAEHRMYLPLAAALTLAVLAAHRVMRLAGGAALAPAALLLLFFVAGTLSWRTITRNRDYHSLETMWRNVVTHRPANPRALSNLGSVLAENGELNDSIEVFRRALEFPEYRDVVYLNMGKVYGLAGETELALTAYKNALIVNPDRTSDRLTLANLYVARGRKEEAIEQFEEVLRLEPDNAEARADLGRVFASQRNLTEAAFQLERALALKPNDALVRNNLAGVYAMQGQQARAIDQVVAALELDPAYVDAADNLARLLALAPDPESVAARYADRIQTDEVLAKAYVNRGDAARRSGQTEAARAAYLRALQIRPDLKIARARLASMIGK